ncbi:MAG: hypothetical protein PVI77_24190, partial [Desulfobacterales bacterium]
QSPPGQNDLCRNREIRMVKAVKHRLPDCRLKVIPQHLAGGALKRFFLQPKFAHDFIVGQISLCK